MTLAFPLAVSEMAFLHEVEQRAGQALAACYQCAKCTAGCPVISEMDYPPHQIIRAIQLGMQERVLSSRTIWLCAACETCSTRCPQDVDLPAIMDALRQVAYARNVKLVDKEVPLFHRIFLAGVKRYSRVFELGMMLFYNVLSGHYLKDVTMAPEMLLKGKLGMLPPRVKGAGDVQKLFNKVSEVEAQSR
jgi:heterodisulfide reductase subunit C